MERQTSPLWDASLGIEQRLDWLLQALSLEEKLNMLSTLTPEITRLGIRSTYLGEDAPHGVEAKHDRQENWGQPRMTTTFPQPIGMSQSWNPTLMKEIGEAVSCEARILYEAEGRHGGICRWSPLAEPARDPRWGRTEESYGEDPLLAGKMAAAYISGLRGDDPEYIRTASSLREFYGCSREGDLPEASIDPKSAAEYYTEPYRRCIEEGGAEAVMAAGHVINGVPGMLNSELLLRVKGEWKLPGHITGPEGGLQRLCGSMESADAAKVLADSLAAGVDCFADDPEYISAAAHEAYDRGLLTPQLLNRAVRNTFRTRLRLGMFNRPEEAPFPPEPPEKLAGAAHGALARTAGQESVVLLKNKSSMLPLSPQEGDTIAVIGPLADEWFKDWNGGLPPYRRTVCDGIREAFPDCKVTYTDGKERVRILTGGQYLRLYDDAVIGLGSRADAEEFSVTDWGAGRISLQASSNGRYVTVCDDGILRASREEVFGKPVRECFFCQAEENQLFIHTSDGRPVILREGKLSAADNENDRTGFSAEMAWNGEERAAKLAQEANTVVLVLGTNPVVGCCAGEDRTSLDLPMTQRRLFERTFQENKNLVLVVISNYPHTLEGLREAPAIVFSPSGCQSLGQSIADILSGKVSPSGHLTMTWYRNVSDLPDMADYDVRASHRTYQYRLGGVEYPFGYGLSYTSFACEAFTLQKGEKELTAAVAVRNTGACRGAALIRLYSRRETSEGWQERLRLISFQKVFLDEGECAEVTLHIPWQDLMEYDVVTESMVLPEGEYRIWLGDEYARPVWLGSPVLGRDSLEENLQEAEDVPDNRALAVLFLEGDIRMRRDFANITEAKLFDSCRNIRLTMIEDRLCACVKDTAQPGTLLYEKGENSSLGMRMRLQLCGKAGSAVKVTINQRESFSFDADTAGVLTEQEIELPRVPEGEEGGFARISIELSGDTGLSSFWFVSEE